MAHFVFYNNKMPIAYFLAWTAANLLDFSPCKAKARQNGHDRFGNRFRGNPDPGRLLRRKRRIAFSNPAIEKGINFFDSARAYTDSEEKMGRSFAGARDGIYLSTQSALPLRDRVREERSRSASATSALT